MVSTGINLPLFLKKNPYEWYASCKYYLFGLALNLTMTISCQIPTGAYTYPVLHVQVQANVVCGQMKKLGCLDMASLGCIAGTAMWSIVDLWLPHLCMCVLVSSGCMT